MAKGTTMAKGNSDFQAGICTMLLFVLTFACVIWITPYPKSASLAGRYSNATSSWKWPHNIPASEEPVWSNTAARIQESLSATRELGSLSSAQLERFGHLRFRKDKKYFFVVHIREASDPVPWAVAEAIYFLGVRQCELSIVRSGGMGDGDPLRGAVEEMRNDGLSVNLFTDQEDGGSTDGKATDSMRIRNLALQPLIDKRYAYSTRRLLRGSMLSEATVLFIENEPSVETADVLELIHQQTKQRVDMVCATGFSGDSKDLPTSLNMKGLPLSKNDAYEMLERPLQVFSCWSKAVVFPTSAIIDAGIRFRDAYEGECVSVEGATQRFSHDMWYHRFNRIALVPTRLGGNGTEEGHRGCQVKWTAEPPAKVQCQQNAGDAMWVPWEQPLALNDHRKYRGYKRTRIE